MRTIKTTWGKVFENDGLVLFNNYPKIVGELNSEAELFQWYDNDEEEYDNEIYQWYIVPNESTVEWLKRFLPRDWQRYSLLRNYWALYFGSISFWNGLGCCSNRVGSR